MRTPRVLTPKANRVAAIALSLFAGVQLLRPSVSNPPATAPLAVPPDVDAILRTSCFDCHSNETKLRWFDRIVPAYWLVARDVRNGRERLNFSELGRLPAPAQRAALFEAVNYVSLGAMPPRQYTLLHPRAKVSREGTATLEHYLVELANAAPATSAAQRPTAAKSGPARDARVSPSPNGIPFFADYANWATVSATDRFDNRTIRLVLGNAVTTKAIAEQRIHPWPDGAAFAKIAWAPMNERGSAHASKFVQVEFMIKDATRYASTEGWGWARWIGDDHAPYGKDASFVRECTGCHAPMHDNDFVFTAPLLAGPHGRAVDISLDDANDTMSITTKSGASVARVTWKRRADPHWFGARIPGAFARVECPTDASDTDATQLPMP